MNHLSEDAADAIRMVAWRWYRYRDATTSPDQASALVDLSNAIFDATTFHPDFSPATGEIQAVSAGGTDDR